MNLKILSLCFLICLLHPSQGYSKTKLSEIEIGTGFSWNHLDPSNGDNYKSTPFFLKLGFDMNEFLNLHDHKGIVQAAIEPFLGATYEPNMGAEAGIGLFLNYRYSLTRKITPFLEIGSGPIYFGVNTIEQDKSGFNFLSQGGFGLQYEISKNKTFNIHYRYRHLSHAELRDTSNKGIDSHALLFGISYHFN